MKIIGAVLIALGLALMVFLLFMYLGDRDKMVSPIPEERGVKVIFVTPQSDK